MLETLRKQKRGIFGLIIVAFCGALMLPFGLDMIRTGGNSQDSAIKVNDTKLDARQFYNRLQQIQESYRSQLGENFTAFRKMLNLEQRTADDLVHGVLIDSFIENLGLGANLTQIEEKIASHPFFKDTGITKSGFETFLRVQGLNSAGLEAITKRQILVEQVDKLFSNFSTLSKKEEENLKKLNSRTAKFKFIEFKPDNYKSEVKIEGEDKLKAYFKDHENEYLTKKTAEFSAVAFTPQEHIALVQVDNEEIQETYNNDQTEYFNPAQVRIKQYVVNKDRFITNSEDQKKSDADLAASTATAKEYINKADQKLKAGEDFDKVVGQDSDQPVDAGWLDYKILEPQVRSVVNSLKAGEVSGVIETEKYFKIVKVEEQKEKTKKSFDEVKAQIETKIKNENAPEYARAAAESFLNKIENDDLNQAAEKNSKKLITTSKAISQDEVISGITPNTVKQILKLQEGNLELINDGETSYVVKVSKVNLPQVPNFETVSEQIKEAVTAEQASALAKKSAEEVINNIISGNINFEQIAKDKNLEIKKSDFISKNKAAIAPFSIDANKTIALGLNNSNPIAKEALLEGGIYYVVGLEEEKFEEQAGKENEPNEQEQGANRLFETLIKYLKSQADIKIDPALLESNA